MTFFIVDVDVFVVTSVDAHRGDCRNSGYRNRN